MGIFLDLTGKKFGRLTVIGMADSIKRPNGKRMGVCLCVCDCGNKLEVPSCALKSGNTKSCGCLKKEKIRAHTDLIGMKFGKLRVIKYSHSKYNKKTQNYKYYYVCKCDCGSTVIKQSTYLKYRKDQSCGCNRLNKIRLFNKKNKVKHGMRNTRIYRIWQAMKGRCKYPGVHGYENYGGRGIKVCEEWATSFENFLSWSYSHGYDNTLSIDRIDVNGNYEPNNCRWVNNETQCNNKRNTKYITYKGKTQSLHLWCKELNLDHNFISRRLRNKSWSIERIFEEKKHLEKVRH